MAYVREQIHGTSGQDLNKINENFMNIFSKVFGDINFSDTDKKTQNKINTQWLPVQGEGNLDASNPLYIRFFVPPNTTNVKSSNFNVMTEHYRMDSSITSSAESKQEVVSIVSSASPSSNQTSTTQPEQTQTSTTDQQKTQTTTSSTVGVSSVSNATVGVSSVGGGGSTSLDGGGATRFVEKWGTPGGYQYSAPTVSINSNSNVTRLNGGFFYTQGRDDMGTQPIFAKYSGASIDLVDFYMLQHSHYVPSHTHGIPNHSHSITLGGHSHSISMSPHDHTLTIPPHNHNINIPPHSHSVNIPSHSHTVNGSVTIPSHNHTLNEGIKISGTVPQNIKFHINETNFVTLQGGASQNNIDITSHIKIGEWNTIKVTSSSVARAVLYGTIELLIK